MTDEPEERGFHRLELALRDVQAELRELRAELPPRFVNLDEKITYTANELRQMIRGVESDVKRQDVRIDSVEQLFASAMREAQEKRERMTERVEALERWQANLLGKIAAAMFVLATLITIALKVWVKV